MAESSMSVESTRRGHETLEHGTILACFNKLVLAFDQDPLTISNELVAKGLFPPQRGQVDGQRLAKLVTDKVQLKSSRYYDVMGVLSKYKWLCDIVDILQVTYDDLKYSKHKIGIKHPPSDSGEAEMPSGKEPKMKFKCDLGSLPHRESTLSVPNAIVHFDQLTEDEHEDLHAKMNELTKHIYSEFQKLIKQIYESFKKHVNCDSLALTLLQNSIFDEENLDGEENMFHLFKMMHPYCSYFNYELLQDVVRIHGSPQDKKAMQGYIDSFTGYCKVMPCAEEICGNDISQGSSKFVKLKFKLESDREQLKPDVVQNIKRNIADCLEIKPSLLHLSRIKDGCVSLEFLIPSFQVECIFPLSDEQKIALHTELKVISIECDEPTLYEEIKKDPNVLHHSEQKEAHPIIKHEPASIHEVAEGDQIILEVEAECHSGQPTYQWYKLERVPIVGQDKSTLVLNSASIANSGSYICCVTSPSPQKASVFSRYSTVRVLDKKQETKPNLLQVTEHEDASTVEVTEDHPTGQPINLWLKEKTQNMLQITVADLPPDRLSELAGYLKEFSPGHQGDEEEPLQYWEMIAETLRNDLPSKFDSYTEVCLASMNERNFLQDLARRKFPLKTLKEYLERIKCRPALNFFEDAIPPIIKRQPAKNIEVKDGHPIALEMKAECHPGQPLYQWFKGQDPITGQDKNILLIKNAAIAHSGHYTCRVTNPCINDPKKASVFSDYAVVTVVGERKVPSPNLRILQEVGNEIDLLEVSTPKILRHPFSITTQLCNKVELECSAEGAAVYDWYKDGIFLKSSRTNGKLVIETAAPSDSGMYHCVVISNKGGKSTSHKAKVTVAVDITIIKQPEDVMVLIGGQFSLICIANNPNDKKMKYEWFQIQADGGERLTGVGEEFSGHAPEDRNSELKFFCRVSMLGDSTHYILSQTARINVKTVWITEQPRSVKGVIGSPIMLHCKAEGLEPITYSWFRSVTKDGRLKPVYQSTNEWYVINSLAQKHWGYYVCHAENQYEYTASKRVHISAHLPMAATLARRTRPMQPLIKILKQPWSQVVPKGGRFCLLCDAVNSGDEALQYQWHFSGKPIAGATDSKFIRENIDESAYGSYWCLINTSSNSAAAISKTARIEQSHKTPSPVAVSKGRNLAKLEAEMELMTIKKERYAREKVALLIGNQRYEAEELDDLKSPEGDIRELSRELEKLNFKVISLVNLRHSEIQKALEVFYEMLAVPGIYALFYYSGHGFNIPEGRNYLIPVDAPVPLHLEYNIHVDGIIRQMQRKLSRAIVILDCCRTVVSNHIPDDRSSSLDSLPSGLENMSNYVEISSCVDNFATYDSISEATFNSPTTGFPRSCHSFFNKALRDALKIKGLSILHINQLVLTKFRESGLDQRTRFRGSFADDKITLHDAVMMDDPQGHGDLLNKVLATYNQAHSAPKPVFLRGEDLGEVADLVRLEVEFINDFSNVLNVVTKLVLLQNATTVTAKIDYDLDFLKAQGVIAEQGECLIPSSESQPEEEEKEEGGQGKYEPFTITTLRVFNIQRLRSKQPKLKFVLTVTVQTEGRDKVGRVSYEVPLTKHLLNNND